MYLTNTTETLQVILAGAVTTNQSVVTVDYGENTATTFVAGKQRSTTNGTTAVNILTAPAASTQRIVQLLTMTNQDTAPITVTIRTNDGGTLATQFGPVTLQVGERIQFATDTGFTVYTVTGAVKVTAVQSTVEPGYIDGLQLVWNSGTSYSVLSGSCYVPSVGANVNFPSIITKTGLSLSASTWYHLYAFLNEGVPDIEHVTTAPSAPYNGRARTKSGDTTRRYVGSIRTDSGGNIIQFKVDTAGDFRYLTANTAQRILSAGTATVRTTVSGSNFIPVTATHAILIVVNTDTVVFWNLSQPEATTAAILGVAPNTSGSVITFPCSDAQQIDYGYSVAPGTGSAFIDVVGFQVGR